MSLFSDKLCAIIQITSGSLASSSPQLVQSSHSRQYDLGVLESETLEVVKSHTTANAVQLQRTEVLMKQIRTHLILTALRFEILQSPHLPKL